jgi:hypothetical protein
MGVAMEALGDRTDTTTYARPEHVLTKPYALLPCSLLSIVIISPPMAILDNSEKTKEVAG